MVDKHKQKLTRIGQGLAATIGTLAAHTAQTLGNTTPTQNFAAALYQGVITLRAATIGQPLAIYVASGELIQAEVEEAIEAIPLHARDVPAIEQTARAVQLLGLVEQTNPLHLDMGNRLPKFRENIGWQFWAYNPMSAAFTTGAVASGQIWLYGRWQD